MKLLRHLLLALLLSVSLTACDAFRSLSQSKMKSAQGKAYELIVSCPQKEWIGAVGDSLRSLLAAPVPYLNQQEPLFDVMRVQERGLTGLIADHRNILRITVDPSVGECTATVQYNVTAEPQILITLQGPNDAELLEYLSQHGDKLLQALEQAERDRAIHAATTYNNRGIEAAIRKTFGMTMAIPKGYFLAAEQSDFIWLRNEYPKASQGIFIYSYPYTGRESLSEEALIAARNRFAARIPGPANGSYMTTADAFEPAYRMFRLEGRVWCELRGFWDVKGDFMGGPFVSYTTVDTTSKRVITIDGYVYAPDLHKPHKRNYVRGIEHLLYTVEFPPEK